MIDLALSLQTYADQLARTRVDAGLLGRWALAGAVIACEGSLPTARRAAQTAQNIVASLAYQRSGSVRDARIVVGASPRTISVAKDIPWADIGVVIDRAKQFDGEFFMLWFVAGVRLSGGSLPTTSEAREAAKRCVVQVALARSTTATLAASMAGVSRDTIRRFAHELHLSH